MGIGIVDGRLVRHAWRLVFQLAEVAVPREVFRQVLERIAGTPSSTRVAIVLDVGGDDKRPGGRCALGGVGRECKRGESCLRCLANANSRRREMVSGVRWDG